MLVRELNVQQTEIRLTDLQTSTGRWGRLECTVDTFSFTKRGGVTHRESRKGQNQLANASTMIPHNSGTSLSQRLKFTDRTGAVGASRIPRAAKTDTTRTEPVSLDSRTMESVPPVAQDPSELIQILSQSDLLTSDSNCHQSSKPEMLQDDLLYSR